MRTIILRVYGGINLEDSGSNIHSRPPPDALRLRERKHVGEMNVPGLGDGRLISSIISFLE